MSVVILSIKFNPRCFKVDTHASKYSLKVLQNGFCEYAASVFNHKDQMHMHLENAVPPLSNFIFNLARDPVLQGAEG